MRAAGALLVCIVLLFLLSKNGKRGVYSYKAEEEEREIDQGPLCCSQNIRIASYEQIAMKILKQVDAAGGDVLCGRCELR